MKNLLLTITVLIPITGCGIGMPIMTQEQRGVIEDIESLKTENREMKQALAGNTSEVKATIAADIDGLREEFAFIKGESEENKRLLEETRTLTEDIEAKIISIEEKVLALEISFKELSEETSTNKTSAEDTLTTIVKDIEELKSISQKVNDRLITVEKRAAATTKDTSKKSETTGPKTMYNKAFSYINKKDHKTATSKMREFIKIYPKHSLADNALYWIGEMHYADSKWDQAILEFENVQLKYPDGDKAPAALLKQGYAFQRKGDTETAKIVFKKVISKFPKSSSAKKAKERLDEIK